MSKIFYLILFSITFLSCQPNSKDAETTTSGLVKIVVDESLRPVVEAEQMVFTSIYPDAHIDLIFCSEAEAVKLLLSDSVKLAILTRHLTENEKKHFDNRQVTPRYSPFANDAIAIILNKETTDTIFTLTQLSQILDGTISKWNQLKATSPNKPINLVFDNSGSGSIRFLKDSLLKGKPLSKQCFALENNPSVIDYVEKNKNSIGIIGMAWISDNDDSIVRGFLKKINVADIVPKNPATAEAKSLKPYQAYVALKQYPLWRTIEMVNCSGRFGLGTGFASFIASDKGQRIILKSGLVPATAPIRIVKLKNNE